MKTAKTTTLGTTLFLHRWAGILFGVPALLWYGSIFTMHVWGSHYGLTRAERLRAFAPPFNARDLEQVVPPPARDPTGTVVQRALLHRAADRVVWELHLANRGTVVVDAQTGAISPTITARQAVAQAVKSAGVPGTGARADLLTRYTLYYYDDDVNQLPRYRVRLADAEHTDAYVDPTTGAVTTAMDARGRAYRLWGTLLHFTQFWPVITGTRARNALRVLGLTGNLVGTTFGIVFGLWMLGRRWHSLRHRWRFKTGIRLLHYWLGLLLCVVFTAWAASGYLMFLWYRTGTPTPEEEARLAESPLADAAMIAPGEAFAAARRQSAAPVIMLEARRLLGRPVYDVVHPDGRSTLVDGASGVVWSPLPDWLIPRLAAHFLGHHAPIRTVTLLDHYDAFYYGTGPDAPPLPVYRVDLTNHDDPSPLYFDAGTAALRSRVDQAYRVFRWVGQGVHTFDFPPLLEHPGLRDLAVLLPAVLGVLLALSGVWLGAEYLLRTLNRSR